MTWINSLLIIFGNQGAIWLEKSYLKWRIVQVLVQKNLWGLHHGSLDSLIWWWDVVYSPKTCLIQPFKVSSKI